METFFALSGQTELKPNGVAPGNPHSDPGPSEPHVEETVESLHEALRAAQLRVEYFERFGPWVEEQMAAVVERATALERESERRRDETSAEIASLRADVADEIAAARQESERERKEIEAEFQRRREELQELKAESDRKRDEAAATIAHAHATASVVMGRLTESASGIVQRALGDLETLRSGLTPEALAAEAATGPMPEPEATKEPPADSPSDDQRRGWFRSRK